MASQTIPYVSPQEYLKSEREAEFKSEYYDGRVFARASAPRHTRIATNMVAELVIALRGPCQAFNSGMRVHIPASGLYTYPDASVVCGEPIFFDNDNLENPVLIVEVLSKSTEKHDRTAKFLDYQSIPSLNEYLLVSQDSRSITQCTRTSGGEWRIVILNGCPASIRLPGLGIEINFDQIYAGAESLP